MHKPFPGFGRTFPHPFGPADGKYFTTLLTISPAGDEIVLDFAKELVAAESIGTDDITDYLSISFSIAVVMNLYNRAIQITER